MQKDPQYTAFSQHQQEEQQEFALIAKLDVFVDKSRFFEKAKCNMGNFCHLICAEKDCKEPAIVCTNQQCKCHEAHNLCKMINPEIIVKKILQKKKEHPQAAKYLENIFNRLIDFISQVQEKSIQLLKEMVSYDLSYIEKQLVNSVQQQKFQDLSGDIIDQIQRNLKTDKNHQSPLQTLQAELRKYWEKNQKTLQNNIKELQKIISQFKKNRQIQLNFQMLKVKKSQQRRDILAQDQSYQTNFKALNRGESPLIGILKVHQYRYQASKNKKSAKSKKNKNHNSID